MMQNLLTPTSLRWSTLSMTSHKEDEEKQTLFARSGERVVERSNDRVSRISD